MARRNTSVARTTDPVAPRAELPHRWLPTVLRFALRVARQTLLRWRVNRCSQEAAALAFKTALGLVPLLAVAFTLLKAAGKLDERSALLEFFAENLFPADQPRKQAMAQLVGFADKINSGILGPGGLAVLITLGFLLFHDIERFWDHIWAATRRRSLIRSFTVFYMLATLVPFLVGISLYHTARFWRGGFIGFLAPLASSFLALFAANRLLPSVRVKIWCAALGAAVSAVLLEAAKLLFARYVMIALTRYNSVYGAFGLVPLGLLWIYVAWMIVLVGAELTHAAQRLDAIEAGDRRRARDEAWELCTGATAARLMVAVARHYSSGGKAVEMPRLAERLRLPEEVVQRVLERLQARDLLVEVEGDVAGWLPARPPSTIELSEVFAAFRVLGPRGRADDTLGRILHQLEPANSEKARVKLDAILDEADEGEAETISAPPSG